MLKVEKTRRNQRRSRCTIVLNKEIFMMKFLEGKKTHLVALGIVISAVIAFLTGDVTLGEAVALALTGTGFSTLRAGVSKAK